MVEATVEQKVKRQVEYYFSDVNLPKDKFLKGKIAEDKDGFVDLSILITFNRMSQLKVTVEDTAKAIESSDFLELNEERTKVRRTTPLVDLGAFENRSIYVAGLPTDPVPEIEDLQTVFSKFGKVLSVKLRKNSKGESTGTAFVEFEKAENEADTEALIGAVVAATAAKEVRLEGLEKDLDILSIVDFKAKRKSGEIVEEEAGKKKRKRGEEERDYVKGLVLKFEGVGPGVSREDLREVFGEFGAIAWVDFCRDDADGHIRFATVDSAPKAKESLTESKKEVGGKVPSLSLLEGDAEKEFWEHVWAEQDNRRKRIEEKKRQKSFGSQKRFKKKRRDRDRDVGSGRRDNADEDADENKTTKGKRTTFKSDDEGEKEMYVEEKKAEAKEDGDKLVEETVKVVDERKTATAEAPKPAADSTMEKSTTLQPEEPQPTMKPTESTVPVVSENTAASDAKETTEPVADAKEQ